MLVTFLLFSLLSHPRFVFFFFFNDTATTEIYTLSLHDALPIYHLASRSRYGAAYSAARRKKSARWASSRGDRKSTRLNSSHANISYAVFCLKKKKDKTNHRLPITDYRLPLTYCLHSILSVNYAS